MTTTTAIGLYGGTFDPVHNGHLAVANAVLSQLSCQEIRFIPCKQNVLKTQAPGATNQHRVNMLQLALADNPAFNIDQRELNSEHPSYMINTLEAIKQETNNPLYLMMSSDSFNDIEQWQRWQAVLKLSKLVVTPRTNYPISEKIYNNHIIKSLITDSIPSFTQQSQAILLLPLANQVNISATEIRAGIQARQNMSMYLPASVWHYIQQHKLYQQP